MKWSVKIVRVAGIELKIHLTFLLFLGWVALSYYHEGGRTAAIGGTAFVLLLFGCVLLHELGHALTARSFGIQTPDITLLPIGGVARLDRIPEEPKQELLIAIAGPLVNVVIALILFSILHFRGTVSDLTDLQTPRLGMMTKLGIVNVLLVLFNLIPAFPMDGGRVLRALLAMKMNYARATRIAATIGQGLAFLFGFVGLFGLGPVGANPMLVFIALFVYFGASSESATARMKDVTAGIAVGEAMVSDVRKLSPIATLDDAVEAMLHSSRHEFAITDEAGHLLGVLTRDAIVSALRQQDGSTPVTEAMTRGLPAVRPGDTLNKALETMQSARSPVLPVLDAEGRLAGLVTAENVGELLMIESLNPKEGRPSARLRHAHVRG
jgi:Zn-dependent protease/CBS domain-containing protein